MFLETLSSLRLALAAKLGPCFWMSGDRLHHCQDSLS